MLEGSHREVAVNELRCREGIKPLRYWQLVKSNLLAYL